MSVRVETVGIPPQEYDGDALVVVNHSKDSLSGQLLDLDSSADGYFSNLLRGQYLSSDEGKISIHYRVPGMKTPCVVIIGGGSQESWNADVAFRRAGAALKFLGDHPRNRIGLHFGPVDARSTSAAIAGALNGGVGQDLLREDKKLHPPKVIEWLESQSEPSANAAATQVARGAVIGEAMLMARELVNLPSNYLYPESFSRRAAEVAVTSGLELEVWDEIKLRQQGCNALLAVSAGSTRPPRLLILRYPGRKQQPPLALIGKGVTFDSGGLSIKPSDSMLSMKCDMAGAATVLAVMQSVARLQLAAPMVGLVGLTENMISGNCLKLGDVLTSRNGKSIEIHNTDAEGRLVLADVLDVALDESPGQLIDVATLTGACVVALGTEVAGVMSNNEAWQHQLAEAAKHAGELIWPLPMFAHFAEQVQGKIADVKNVGDGRWGGAITAAKFLQEFVGSLPWTHIDIAGPAFSETPKPHLDAGASGTMIRTLVELAESL